MKFAVSRLLVSCSFVATSTHLLVDGFSIPGNIKTAASSTHRVVSQLQHQHSPRTILSISTNRIDTTDIIDTTIEKEKAATISSVFGRPIDDSTKEANRKLVNGVKGFLFDVLYRGKEVERFYARFYALETIARMPYFSYLSVLHLLETLGLWRRVDFLKVHFAESWNEMHHLLIMEELGGNNSWGDRFVAQHIAFFYYWIVVTLYLYNPTLAYNLNQAVEEEAYETYSKFLETHKAYLQDLPAPKIAVDYYTGEDLYMFDSMHTPDSGSQEKVERRRPVINNLYDVFLAIRDDEAEHVKTMAYMQE